MNDRLASITTVSATLLWVAAFVLAGTYAAVGTRGTGVFAVLFMGAGATLTVRRFLIAMADDLIEREHEAYRLGRDSQHMRPVD